MFKNTDSKLEIDHFEAVKRPNIIFPLRTLAIMKFIVETVPQEVGWLGYVEKDGDNLKVTDIYIPGQHVHGSTCELDEGDPLTKVCMQVIEEGKDPSNVKFWGHSHGSGAVFASGQDQTQSMQMMKDLGDFMIRAICNKAGVMSISYFDNINKCSIQNMEWYIHDGVDRNAIKAEFEPIIKENVKEFTYRDESKNAPMTGTEQEGYPLVYGRGAGNSPTNLNGKTVDQIKRIFEERSKRGGKTRFTLAVGGGK